MRISWAKIGPYVKGAVALLILAGVSWQFYRLLNRSELRDAKLHLEPGWLALALLMYLLAVGSWALNWVWLVRRLGDTLPFPRGSMAYFASQLGKYVPGKALVVIIRTAIARQAGVRMSAAALTSISETLTCMAAGAMIATLLLPIVQGDSRTMWWKALVLLAVAGVPVLPGVFNRLASRATRPFLTPDAPPLPKLTLTMLLRGLLHASFGWMCLGLSLLATIRALHAEAAATTGFFWLTCTAFVAIAYVAGFLSLPMPGGIGVREFILQTFLAAELGPRLGSDAEGVAVVIVLVLRLLWSGSEVTLAFGSLLIHRLTKVSA